MCLNLLTSLMSVLYYGHISSQMLVLLNTVVVQYIIMLSRRSPFHFLCTQVLMRQLIPNEERKS